MARSNDVLENRGPSTRRGIPRGISMLKLTRQREAVQCPGNAGRRERISVFRLPRKANQFWPRCLAIEKDTFLGRNPGAVAEGCPGPRGPEKHELYDGFRIGCKNGGISNLNSSFFVFFFFKTLNFFLSILCTRCCEIVDITVRAKVSRKEKLKYKV